MKKRENDKKAPRKWTIQERKRELNKRFFDAVGEILPDASAGIFGSDTLGGTLYYAYVPPTEDFLRQKLEEIFADFVSEDQLEAVISSRLPQKNSHLTTDRSDLVSRVREKLMLDFLREVEAEFLASLYETTRELIPKLAEIEDHNEFFKLLDAIHRPQTSFPITPTALKNKRSYKIKRELVADVLTKEVKFEAGRPEENLPVGASEYCKLVHSLIKKAKYQSKNSQQWEANLRIDNQFSELFKYQFLIDRIPTAEPQILAREYTRQRFDLGFMSDSAIRNKLKQAVSAKNPR